MAESKSTGSRSFRAGLREGLLAPRGPGRKTRPLPCCSTRRADAGDVLRGQFAFAEADVAEENHVVLRELLLSCGKVGEVTEAVARCRCPGWKQQRLHLHAGIAHEGVAQVAVFPARQGIDDEHLEFFRADGDVELLVVVFRDGFVGLDREMEVEIVIAGLGGSPDQRIGDFAEGGDGDRLAGELPPSVSESMTEVRTSRGRWLRMWKGMVI